MERSWWFFLHSNFLLKSLGNILEISTRKSRIEKPHESANGKHKTSEPQTELKQSSRSE